MNFLKNLKKNFLKSAQNNLSLAIYSMILAILAWFVISMTFYPSVPKTIENVSLKIDITGTPAAENGLSVISQDVDTVKVKIRGSRTQVGNMNSESLIAYVDADNITSTGKKTLTVKVKSNTSINYEVDSIYPATVNVVFDKYDTREFPVTPVMHNLTVAEGKTYDPEELSCEPEFISITGPSDQLDKIAKCCAVSDKELSLDTSYTGPSDSIELYGADGSVMSQTNLKFNKSSFLITVPILTQKTAKLTVGISNQPSNFDVDWLMDRFSLSAETIDIASGSTLSEIPEAIEIGSIKLSDITLDYSNSFDIKKILEDAGLKNQSNISTVNVDFDSAGLTTREFTISGDRIRTKNKPSVLYDYTVVTNSIDITVIGPEETLKQLTANDFTVEANLLGNDSSTMDQFPNDVEISCPDYDQVWSVSKVRVYIKKTTKTSSST